jgi:hypothetical protein
VSVPLVGPINAAASHIMGASGSGVTSLGRAFANTSAQPHRDADNYFLRLSLAADHAAQEDFGMKPIHRMRGREQSTRTRRGILLPPLRPEQP